MSQSDLSELEPRASHQCQCECPSECEPQPGPSNVNYDHSNYDSDDNESDDESYQPTETQFNSHKSSLPCNLKEQQQQQQQQQNQYPHAHQVYLIAEPKSEKSIQQLQQQHSHHPKLHQLMTISLTPVNDIELLNANEYISADVLILKELNEMKIILNQLLEQNRDLTLLQSPNSNSALVSMVEEDLNVLALIKHRTLAFEALDRLTSEFMDSNGSSNSISSNNNNYPLHSASDSNLFESSIQVLPLQGQIALRSLNKSPNEPHPHFPVGDQRVTECQICLETKPLYLRKCCEFAACSDCLTSYFASKVELGIVSIECINLQCKDFVFRDEISIRLPLHLKSTFVNLLMNFNCDGLKKTCPKCNHPREVDSISTLKSMVKSSTKNATSTRVVCDQCNYPWCFVCCAPWHEGITCKSYQKGDQMLYEWARKHSEQGQVNAQRCPKCKILISKSSGCDHMHCLRCKTDFCYRCGDTLRRLKFFGDHYSKLSIFGCKYRYKAQQPLQRKLIRGAVFGSKLIVAPVLGSLALFAGAAVIGVGIAALPFYGGVRLYRKYQNISLTGKSANYSTSGPRLRRAKGLVSTGAQTVSFIGDNYVDEFNENGTRVV